MDPLQKIKHCAPPSLAIQFEEYKKKKKCMKVDRQNHAECCGCKEPCCIIKLPDKSENQNSL